MVCMIVFLSADQACIRGQSAGSCLTEYLSLSMDQLCYTYPGVESFQHVLGPIPAGDMEHSWGGLFFFFFKVFLRRCSRFMHLSQTSHRGMLIFALSVFQPVCVCVSGESWGWFTPGGQALAHFLFLSCVLCQESLCHQLSACQCWILLFQSADQLTFHLSLLHLPPQHARKRQKVGRRCSWCPCAFVPSYLFSLEASLHSVENVSPCSRLPLYFLCPSGALLIKPSRRAS